MNGKFEVIGRMVDVSDHCRILLEGNGRMVKMTIRVKNHGIGPTYFKVSVVAEKSPGFQVSLLEEQEMERGNGWLECERHIPVDDFYTPVRVAVYFGAPGVYPNHLKQYMVEMVEQGQPMAVGKRWVQMVLSRLPGKTDDEILSILSGLLDKDK